MSPVRRVLIAGLFGGFALFVWSVVTWTLLPLQRDVARTLPNEDRWVASLRDADLPGGIYVFPGVPDPRGIAPEERERLEQERADKMRRGPIGLLVYDPQGTAPNRMFWPIVRGLAMAVAAALFSAWTLSRVRVGSWALRIAFVLGLGVFAWTLGPGAQWAWFHYPSDYLSATLVDVLGGWLIVGIVQTGIVRNGQSRQR